MSGGHFPKCEVPGCNQHRTRDDPRCGNHLRDAEHAERMADRDLSLAGRIHLAESVEDLKVLLLEIAERLEA